MSEHVRVVSEDIRQIKWNSFDNHSTDTKVQWRLAEP